MNGQHPPRNVSYTVPVYDTTALTLALANPYAQHASSHYYQAYVQAYANSRPRTTTDGYTLSSTYVPGLAGQTSRTPHFRDQPSVQPKSQPIVKPIRNHLTFGSWYQPGNGRCTRPGCPFTGSHKSVEIHMMDRHLIFPSGWKKSKDDWDADPSLKGKPIAIQGTSLVLDTPEEIDAWITERKKRFPTEEKVQEKKRKLEEAVARGELTPEDMGIGTRKRRRQDTAFADGASRGTRGRVYQRGRGRRREGWARREEPGTGMGSRRQLANEEVERAQGARPSSTSITDDDEAPEVVSSKLPTASSAVNPCVENIGAKHDKEAQESLEYAPCPRRVPQPKKPPRNPFASRSTLLRNLLLPEIRITVSNLSQAIHFLVENDFLRGVELRPGEAQERMIEVLGSTETPCLAELPSS